MTNTIAATTASARRDRRVRWISAMEVAVVTSSVLALIWIVQPLGSAALDLTVRLIIVAAMVASNIAHGDSPKRLGLRFDNFSAATRMTVDLPGFEDSEQRLAPELVTPAVIFLCSEQAPNGRIIQAAGGRFYSADIRENPRIDLGLKATAEDVAANIDRILDMTENVGVDQRPGHRLG